MESRRPPYVRHGHESFRYRSQIVDQYDDDDCLRADHISRAVTDFVCSSGTPAQVSSSLPSGSGPSPSVLSRGATYPDSARQTRKTKLLQLQRATVAGIVTNDLTDVPHSISEEDVFEDEACRVGCLGFTVKGDGEEESSPIQDEKVPVTVAPVTEHERNAGAYTVIAFVNSGSGGGMGKTLYTSLKSHLGPENVIDLRNCRRGYMPEDFLLQYAHDPMVRVLACGGDGTCGWIFSSLDKVWSTVLGQSSSKSRVHLSKFKDHLPLAIMPLGTGNDLSRQYRWGGAFQNHMKEQSMITSVQSATLTSLDRWRCIIMPLETMDDDEKELVPKILGESLHPAVNVDDVEEADYSTRAMVDVLQSLLTDDDDLPDSSKRKPEKMEPAEPKADLQMFDGVFCNYFSLGFDATIAYHFHHERETHPEKFTSPIKNKVVYVQKSPYALRAPKLRKRVKVLVNNEKGQLVKLKIPKSCRAIVLMNIQSYGGGNRLSKKGCPTDGLIEVIFVSNLIRAVSSAMSPVMPFLLFRVAAQTNNVCIRTRCALHCQVDGEPWLQDEGVIQVKFHSRNSILEKARVDKSCGCMGGNPEDTVIE